MRANFEPRKEQDRIKDPVPHDNDEMLRRRFKQEEVIRQVGSLRFLISATHNPRFL